MKKKTVKNNYNISRNEIPVSPNNRITYIFKENRSRGNLEVIEVTCVSLEIKVGKKWETIVYYDSSHEGVLHRHIRMSLINNSDLVYYEGVPKHKNQRKLLTWAITDLQRNYLYYKRSIIKRSKDNIDITEIELY